MALLRETGVGGPEESRLPYPRHNAPVTRAITWKPSSDAYYLLAANLRGSGYEHEIYLTQRVLLQIQEHAASTERDVDGTLWGRIFVSPDSGATYVLLSDATPSADRDGEQGPLRRAGWYCSRQEVDVHPSPEDVAIHLERCTGGWEPLIVLTNGGQPNDGALFLVSPVSGRAFRAPFRELLEPNLVRPNAPKRSCIPWRGYATDEPVVALPMSERGTARRAHGASDIPRSTVSLIAEGVAADVRAAARAVSRVMGTGSPARAPTPIPTPIPLRDRLRAPPTPPAAPAPVAPVASPVAAAPPTAAAPLEEAPLPPRPEARIASPPPRDLEPASRPLAPPPAPEAPPRGAEALPPATATAPPIARTSPRPPPRPAPRRPIPTAPRLDDEQRVPTGVYVGAAVIALVAALALGGLALQRMKSARPPVAESVAGTVGNAADESSSPPQEGRPAAAALPRAQALLLAARGDSLRLALAWYQEIAADHREGKLGCTLVVQARDRVVVLRDSLSSLLASVPEGASLAEQRRLLADADSLERAAADSDCRAGAVN